MLALLELALDRQLLYSNTFRVRALLELRHIVSTELIVCEYRFIASFYCLINSLIISACATHLRWGILLLLLTF